MNRLGTGALGGSDDSVAAEIAVRRRAGTEQVRLVGSGRHAACPGRAPSRPRRSPIPSSRSVRKILTAISPRLATRTFENGAMRGVFSRTVTLPDQLTVRGRRRFRSSSSSSRWDFPNHAYWATTVFVRRDGDGPGRRLAGAAQRYELAARQAPGPGRGQGARSRGARDADRRRSRAGVDGRADRRPGAPRLRAPPRRARTRRGPRRAGSRPPQDLGAGGRRGRRRTSRRPVPGAKTSRGGLCSSRSSRRGSQGSTTRASRRACCGASERSEPGGGPIVHRFPTGRSPPRRVYGSGAPSATTPAPSSARLRAARKASGTGGCTRIGTPPA